MYSVKTDLICSLFWIAPDPSHGRRQPSCSFCRISVSNRCLPEDFPGLPVPAFQDSVPSEVHDTTVRPGNQPFGRNSARNTGGSCRLRKPGSTGFRRRDPPAGFPAPHSKNVLSAVEKWVKIRNKQNWASGACPSFRLEAPCPQKAGLQGQTHSKGLNPFQTAAERKRNRHEEV